MCRRSCVVEVPLGSLEVQGFVDTVPVSVRICLRRMTTMWVSSVSAPLFDSFNLGDCVGDDPAAKIAKRARLAAAIGLGAGRVVWINQVYGDRVEVVDEPQSVAVGGKVGIDALVTRASWLALVAVAVDCVPVFLPDACGGVAAVVDAGQGRCPAKRDSSRGGHAC